MKIAANEMETSESKRKKIENQEIMATIRVTTMNAGIHMCAGIKQK